MPANVPLPLEPAAASVWRRTGKRVSLSESHGSVAVPVGVSPWRKLLAFSGPGYLVAVGYMDPGNWATDLQGGAQFGYTLLSVILISNLLAILLQHFSIKLGVATGRDLAQACRDSYSRPVVIFQWVMCELAIAACDLAEVVGSAIGLQLLFGIPLVWGCIITAADVLIVLALQRKGFRKLEALVVMLILTIAVCFAIELFLAKPSLAGIAFGFAPSPDILRNPAMLYLAIGILGATVMPHNLYLHSSIVQTRAFAPTSVGKREAIRYATYDVVGALLFALLVNAAILILAAAAFHGNGHEDVGEIQQAYHLLDGVFGVTFASFLFAFALLASGQNSTLTGTLAGQIVMEGFLDLQMPPWLRRLVTRLLAVVPAVVIISFYGEQEATKLIVASQVCLSLQLGFAVWPLVRFTSDRAKMGEFTNPSWLKGLGWASAILIIGLNLKLLVDIVLT